MRLLKLAGIRALLAAAALISASAGAAPILSDVDGVNSSRSGSIAEFTDTAQTPLFLHMGLNGGHRYSVAFLGDDDSVLIGHYSRGPWVKSEFLRNWRNDHEGQDFQPSVETIAVLPEPSTLALLAVALLAIGLLRRQSH